MKRLYHVTHERNIIGIERRGVDPHFATGRMKVSWYVEFEDVAWALAHVSARYAVSVDTLVVVEVFVDEEQVMPWMTRTLWCANKPLRPNRFLGWEAFVNPEV